MNCTIAPLDGGGGENTVLSEFSLTTNGFFTSAVYPARSFSVMIPPVNRNRLY